MLISNTVTDRGESSPSKTYTKVLRRYFTPFTVRGSVKKDNYVINCRCFVRDGDNMITFVSWEVDRWWGEHIVAVAIAHAQSLYLGLWAWVRAKAVVEPAPWLLGVWGGDQLLKLGAGDIVA